MSNQPDKALARFDQVLEADPTYVDAYFFKAETYARMGNKAEANRFLDEYKTRVNNPEAAHRGRELSEIELRIINLLLTH